jgi:hypothetical protein
MQEEALGRTPSIFDIPPQGQWAECQVIKDGEVIERFRVPFTQTELDSIVSAGKARLQPDFIKGIADGGPEREHNNRFFIPDRHGLHNRRRAIEELRETEKEANAILESGSFTPNLNSMQAVLDIKNALALFKAS